MPVVEIASFTASKAFFADVAVADFTKAIGALKKTEECLSVYHGFQLEDKTRAYVIITWKSYEKYASISKGDKYTSFRFELDKLGLSLDDLSTQFLVFDDDPATVLDSPLPELRIIQVKPGHTLVELDSIVKTFYTEVKNDKYPELTFEDLPTLAWGPDKQNLGSSTYIVGWKGFESRELVLQTRRIVELLEMVQPVIHLEYKCLSLTRA